MCIINVMHNSFDLKCLDGVEGYLRVDEAELLFQLAQNCTCDGVIIEIGSWKGRSTICLAKGSQQGKKKMVYAIDPHSGSEEHTRTFGAISTLDTFLHNIAKAKVGQLIKPLIMTGHAASKVVKEPVSLLFIDGAHDYESVKPDYLDCYPKLSVGGIIAFHDTISWPGPRQVVRDYLFNSQKIKNIKVIGSICYGTKTDKINLLVYLSNQYTKLLMDLRIVALGLHLPAPIHRLVKRLYEYVR